MESSLFRKKNKIVCLLDMYKEIYEYTKGVIRDRKTKDRQYKRQRKMIRGQTQVKCQPEHITRQTALL